MYALFLVVLGIVVPFIRTLVCNSPVVLCIGTGKDYTTISAALSAVTQQTQIIAILEGTYTESLVIQNNYVFNYARNTPLEIIAYPSATVIINQQTSGDPIFDIHIDNIKIHNGDGKLIFKSHATSTSPLISVHDNVVGFQFGPVTSMKSLSSNDGVIGVLIDSRNATESIKVNGVTFSGMFDTVINVQWTNKFIIEHCKFQDVSGTALKIEECSNAHIRNNYITLYNYTASEVFHVITSQYIRFFNNIINFYGGNANSTLRLQHISTAGSRFDSFGWIRFMNNVIDFRKKTDSEDSIILIECANDVTTSFTQVYIQNNMFFGNISTVGHFITIIDHDASRAGSVYINANLFSNEGLLTMNNDTKNCSCFSSLSNTFGTIRFRGLYNDGYAKPFPYYYPTIQYKGVFLKSTNDHPYYDYNGYIRNATLTTIGAFDFPYCGGNTTLSGACGYPKKGYCSHDVNVVTTAESDVGDEGVCVCEDWWYGDHCEVTRNWLSFLWWAMGNHLFGGAFVVGAVLFVGSLIFTIVTIIFLIFASIYLYTRCCIKVACSIILCKKLDFKTLFKGNTITPEESSQTAEETKEEEEETLIEEN